MESLGPLYASIAWCMLSTIISSHSMLKWQLLTLILFFPIMHVNHIFFFQNTIIVIHCTVQCYLPTALDYSTLLFIILNTVHISPKPLAGCTDWFIMCNKEHETKLPYLSKSLSVSNGQYVVPIWINFCQTCKQLF